MFSVLKRLPSTFYTLRQSLSEDVQAVFDRDPAARNTLEVLLTYPGIHALLLHRIAHEFWQKDNKGTARVISYGNRFLTGIEIHPAAKIGRRFFIDHGMGVVIGETAEIGNDVTLYHGVTLGGVALNEGKRHPTLEDGVVVGAGAKILGSFTVGKYAKIGSNAVVVKAVPAGATMVGSAARMIYDKTLAEQAGLDSLANSRDILNQEETPTATNPKNPNTSYPSATSEPLEKNTLPHSVFLQYGIDPNSADPVTQTISKMLTHIQQTEKRLDEMQTTLCQLDPSFCKKQYRHISPADLQIFLPNFSLDSHYDNLETG